MILNKSSIVDRNIRPTANNKYVAQRPREQDKELNKSG